MRLGQDVEKREAFLLGLSIDVAVMETIIEFPKKIKNKALFL